MEESRGDPAPSLCDPKSRKIVVMMEKKPYTLIFILTSLLMLSNLYGYAQHQDKAKTFDVQKEYTHRGKTYQVGRMLLKDFQYGPLTLRVIEKDTITDIIAPIDEYPDLEMSRVELIQLHGRPFFFVIDRYRVYLVDLQNEKISARIQPGVGVEYGDDSISGTING